MALRILWDIYEAVILLDALINVLNEKISRKKAIEVVSEELRQRAIKNGMKIDDVFRNTNGITLQMSVMEYAFTNGKYGLKKHGTPEIFRQAINLYHNDRKEYEKILKEAKNMTTTESVKNQFFEWLATKVSKSRLSEMYIMYDNIEYFCLKRNILKEKLFETTNINDIKKAVNNLESNKIFSIMYRKKHVKMCEAIRYYYAFLREHPELCNNDIKQSVIPHIENKPEINTVSEKSTSNDTIINNTPEQVTTNNNIYTVNYYTDNSMAYTKPVSFAYFEDETDVKNWTQLFVEVVKTLLDDYPSILKKFINQSIEGGKGITFTDESGSREMIAPHKVAYNFYVETNFSATNILKKVKTLLDLCNLDYENLEIKYIKTNSTETPNDNIKYNTATNEPENKDEKYNDSLIDVLKQCFSTSYRLQSHLDWRRLQHSYESITGEKLTLSQKEVEYLLEKNCIVYDGKAYKPETMLSEEMKNRVFSYIEDNFNQGKKTIYYQAVFQEFSNEFLDHNIYDDKMLRKYLAYTAKNKYFYQKNYMTKELFVRDDPIDEIRTCLTNNILPMKFADLNKVLSHIPSSKIKQILTSNAEFALNGKQEYFCADSLVLTDDDLKKIKNLIEQSIQDQEFISGNELYDAIKAKYPYMCEQNEAITPLGWRNALKYKLYGDFSFNGNIISTFGSRLSMGDCFENFAKSRDRFTIDELLNFAKNNLDTTVYYDSLYKYATRASHDEFVSKNECYFNVNETDKTLDIYCSEDYIPLSYIREFAVFPEAFMPWNIYLLEQYVAFYSDKYQLFHNNFNNDCVVGAIVKKTSNFSSFDDLIVDVLAKSNVELKKSQALDYLASNGYIGRRSMDNIETLLINARAIRNRKEK